MTITQGVSELIFPADFRGISINSLIKNTSHSVGILLKLILFD